MLTKKPGFKDSGALSRYANDVKRFPIKDLQECDCSDSSIRFIKSLMAPSPDERPSAREAKLHEWMNVQTEPTTSPGGPEIPKYVYPAT